MKKMLLILALIISSSIASFANPTETLKKEGYVKFTNKTGNCRVEIVIYDKSGEPVSELTLYTNDSKTEKLVRGRYSYEATFYMEKSRRWWMFWRRTDGAKLHHTEEDYFEVRKRETETINLK